MHNLCTRDFGLIFFHKRNSQHQYFQKTNLKSSLTFLKKFEYSYTADFQYIYNHSLC